jgi:hypothetical protein
MALKYFFSGGDTFINNLMLNLGLVCRAKRNLGAAELAITLWHCGYEIKVNQINSKISDIWFGLH